MKKLEIDNWDLGYKHGQDTASGKIGTHWMLKTSNEDEGGGWLETHQFEYETREVFKSMSHEEFYHEFVVGWIDGYNEYTVKLK